MSREMCIKANDDDVVSFAAACSAEVKIEDPAMRI